ncbi:hypothetical protein [Streptomyces sp. RK75]|uniref:hypothetical protein n=1 Tax=Streptomyces sp. RK75 TaxID=2824895 RepID=UPI001B366966|nr:hypothetical protein [Streptomyces sp. RK75]MBQ0864109.1 hypothetical protein [Streptomyces sp. RK75]
MGAPLLLAAFPFIAVLPFIAVFPFIAAPGGSPSRRVRRFVYKDAAQFRSPT